MYRAVLFDFDYTLGDATDAILTGFTHALTTMGYPAPQREAVRLTIGMPVREAYTHLTGDDRPEAREQFYDLFHPVARDLQAQGQVELFPGAAELLEALHRHGIPVGIVSTKNSSSLGHIIAVKGLSDFVTCAVGGDQVSQPKPSPEGLLWALDQFKVSPDQALYCGDTTIDAETARRAGATFCAVLNGTTPAQAFSPFRTAYIAPSLSALQAWLAL